MRYVFNTLAIGLCLSIIILSMWSASRHNWSDTHIVILNTRQPLLHTTSKNFLSVSIDTFQIRNLSNVPIENERFINLARHLSPAYIRIGGTSADCLYFNQVLLCVLYFVTSLEITLIEFQMFITDCDRVFLAITKLPRNFMGRSEN